MKRLLGLVVLIIFLSGCKSNALDQAMALREQMLQSDGCSFDAKVTADYGDELYEFQMYCEADSKGTVSFSVTSPETIAGIAGTISDEGGKIIFDGHALLFELLADGQITPVSAPWLLVKTLRGGYLNACTYTENGMMLLIDDSYENNALKLEIWLDSGNMPTAAEILWDGRRILSLEVSNFAYL